MLAIAGAFNKFEIELPMFQTHAWVYLVMAIVALISDIHDMMRD